MQNILTYNPVNKKPMKKRLCLLFLFSLGFVSGYGQYGRQKYFESGSPYHKAVAAYLQKENAAVLDDELFMELPRAMARELPLQIGGVTLRDMNKLNDYEQRRFREKWREVGSRFAVSVEIEPLITAGDSLWVHIVERDTSLENGDCEDLVHWAFGFRYDEARQEYLPFDEQYEVIVRGYGRQKKPQRVD